MAETTCGPEPHDGGPVFSQNGQQSDLPQTSPCGPVAATLAAPEPRLPKTHSLEKQITRHQPEETLWVLRGRRDAGCHWQREQCAGGREGREGRTGLGWDCSGPRPQAASALPSSRPRDVRQVMLLVSVSSSAQGDGPARLSGQSVHSRASPKAGCHLPI